MYLHRRKGSYPHSKMKHLKIYCVYSLYISKVCLDLHHVSNEAKHKNTFAVYNRRKEKMKKITARFNSKCAETGATIRKGDFMFYDYSAKKCYCMNSVTVTNLLKFEQSVSDNVAGMIQANEEAYFDNFCAYNNI